MKRIRLLKRCLWILNVLIALVIAGEIRGIATSAGESRLADIFEPIAPEPAERMADPPPSSSILLDLSNPIDSGSRSFVPSFKARLLGTLSRTTAGRGWVFLRAGNREFPLELGSPLPEELRDWTLVEIGRGSAVLSDGRRRKTLLIE